MGQLAAPAEPGACSGHTVWAYPRLMTSHGQHSLTEPSKYYTVEASSRMGHPHAHMLGSHRGFCLNQDERNVRLPPHFGIWDFSRSLSFLSIHELAWGTFPKPNHMLVRSLNSYLPQDSYRIPGPVFSTEGKSPARLPENILWPCQRPSRGRRQCRS